MPQEECEEACQWKLSYQTTVNKILLTLILIKFYATYVM